MVSIKLFLAQSLMMIFLFSASSCLPVFTEEAKSGVSAKPILRIETGMHTAMISRISTDAKLRVLASASDDKTVRMWDISDINSSVKDQSQPKLIRVFRPPVGDGNEGRLYAVALNPEGTVLATGGWTSKDGLSNSIYFFEVSTGNLLYSISGLEQRILHISFSKNGEYLSVNLKAGKGLRIYQKIKDKYELFAEDRDYKADSYWSEFYSESGENGQLILASTCNDGNIRLYKIDRTHAEKVIKPESRIQTKSGKEPFGLAFSPNGKNIAVGYSDSKGLDIYKIDKNRLEHFFSPDTSSVTKGTLSTVVYSGDSLFAGGRYRTFDSVKGMDISNILKFPELGKGRPTEYPVSQTTIMQILPDGKGGVFFGAGDPRIGQLNGNGRMEFSRGPEIPDYRGIGETFSISDTDQKFQFAYEFMGKDKALFSLTERTLLSESSNGNSSAFTENTKSFNSPLLDHDEIKIENWYNSYTPSCNGSPIVLGQNEKSRSLAVKRDGSGFALGTEWSMRFFSSSCKEIWNIPVQSVLWALNLSLDGRFVIGAFADGTIRYFKAKDGKELLAFFPHSDKKRWVIWTPEGYYDASKNGEDLIGWHINRGKDKESDFFSVGKFRDTFYRPDIINKILEFGETEKAIISANKEKPRQKEDLPVEKSLPSVVKIRSPADKSAVTGDSVEIITSIRSPSELPVKELQVRINDSLVKTVQVKFSPDEKEDTKDFDFKLDIPEKKVMEISIVAVTEKGPSDPTRIQLLGKKDSDKKPNLHLLSIGVGHYKDDKNVRTLNYSVSDAKDFFSIMKKQEGTVYEKVNADKEYLLTDDKATRAKILYLIKEIRNRAKPEDLSMIFLSGHGRSDADNMFYFLPHDYSASPEEQDATGLSGSELMAQLSNIKGKVILFVDACYSGSLSANGLNFVRFLNEANDPNRRFVVFSSSSQYEVSLEHKEWQNGAFTKAFKEAVLEGKLNEDEITIKGLDFYISRRVPILTKKKQKPESQGTGRDFVIAERVK